MWKALHCKKCFGYTLASRLRAPLVCAPLETHDFFLQIPSLLMHKVDLCLFCIVLEIYYWFAELLFAVDTFTAKHSKEDC